MLRSSSPPPSLGHGRYARGKYRDVSTKVWNLWALQSSSDMVWIQWAVTAAKRKQFQGNLAHFDSFMDDAPFLPALKDSYWSLQSVWAHSVQFSCFCLFWVIAACSPLFGGLMDLELAATRAGKVMQNLITKTDKGPLIVCWVSGGLEEWGTSGFCSRRRVLLFDFIYRTLQHTDEHTLLPSDILQKENKPKHLCSNTVTRFGVWTRGHRQKAPESMLVSLRWKTPRASRLQNTPRASAELRFNSSASFISTKRCLEFRQ